MVARWCHASQGSKNPTGTVACFLKGNSTFHRLTGTRWWGRVHYTTSALFISRNESKTGIHFRSSLKCISHLQQLCFLLKQRKHNRSSHFKHHFLELDYEIDPNVPSRSHSRRLDPIQATRHAMRSRSRSERMTPRTSHLSSLFAPSRRCARNQSDCDRSESFWCRQKCSAEDNVGAS